MARRLAGRVSEGGTISVFLPKECVGVAPAPTMGGVASATRSLEFAAQWLAGAVVPGAVVVAEDALSRPKDPVLQREQDPWFAVGEQVYLYRRSPASPHAFERLLAKTSAVRQIVLVAQPAPGDLPALERRDLGEDVSDRVSDSVSVALVGAFDGETYLCWTRGG
jgi:hypothetical protein